MSSSMILAAMFVLARLHSVGGQYYYYYYKYQDLGGSNHKN